MGDRISILDTRTGHVRHLVQEPGDDSRYSHGPTRSQTTPISGTVAFPTDGGVTWRSRLLGELTGSRLSVNRSEVTVEAPGGTRLDGALYLPEGPGPHRVAVIVPLGDRSSLWEPAMWLLASGTGVFVYDQRGTGASTGSLYGTERNSHTLETLQLAEDAIAVARRVRQLQGVDPARVGVLGWSQGGWVAAMAASRMPRELAFVVNIAANANPWPEQAQHRFLARLQREGFEGQALDEAERYFEAFRAVTAFRTGWEAYAAVRDQYADTAWYRAIMEIFPFFAYREHGEALAGWSAERAPGAFFRRLGGLPALGIYFEFDQSNPPDSPRRFRRALEEAGNARVVVKTFPGTNHGAWVVDGYGFDPDAIERRNPEVFDVITSWVAQF
jgi:pimeloyl-ACP methyl ester carboxylesterase